MKKSNKLIIAFIALLYVVPISAMVFDLKNYEKGSFIQQESADIKFNDKLEGFEEEKFNQPIKAILIEGNKNLYVTVNFHKDEQSGIKFNTSIKDQIKTSIDADGNLKISETSTSDKNNYLTLHVFGNALDLINFKNGDGLNLIGNYDSIVVNIDQIRKLEASTTSTFGSLSINAQNVSTVSIYSKTKDANIGLNTGKIYWYSDAPENLKLNLENTEVEFLHENKDKKESNSLHLVTKGQNLIDFNKNKFKAVSGDVSDSTTLLMPVVYLKNLIK